MDLSYPIGKFDSRQAVAPESVPALIDDIAAAPANFRAAVRGLDESQLDTPYRPGGWTVRQTVHHVGDSHMNSFVRFRLALTETEPTITPYDQVLWAELPDMRTVPVEVSLQLIEALHTRWVAMLRALAPADFARTFRHPEIGLLRLDTNLALYSWHGKHHAAHITGLRDRMGWK
jgi:DinB family protein